MIALAFVLACPAAGLGWALSWSPAGDAVVWFNNGKITVEHIGPPRQSLVLGEGYGANWSPSGNKIAYMSMRDNHEEESHNQYKITTVNPDGSGELTAVGRLLWGGTAWSPDGSRLAFTRIEEEAVTDTTKDYNYEPFDVIGTVRSDGSDYREEFRYWYSG